MLTELKLGPFEKLRAPFYTSMGMIGIPLVLAFIVSAGTGTFLQPIVTFAETLWVGFGVASLILGFALLLWVGWSAWRLRLREANA